MSLVKSVAREPKDAANIKAKETPASTPIWRNINQIKFGNQLKKMHD